MSRYKPYPAYKESGVEWLGKVPEGWSITPVKYCTSHIGSGKTPSGGAEVYQDSGILFLRSQNIHDNGLRLDDAVFISPEVDAEMSWSRVKPNDVLLNITGASIGRSCVAPLDIPDANVNQHVCIIRPTDPAISKWMACCFVSQLIQAQIDFSQNGAGREGLNFEQIGKMIVLIPPVEDHEIIAAHLDRETIRIDGLVEKKTRFIELLREKRQALITHAVTKGLVPKAKMKDSGVEWLGEVPEGWLLQKLRHIARIVRGASPRPAGDPQYFTSDNDSENNMPWVTVAEITKDNEILITSTNSYLTPHGVQNSQQFPVGTLLFSNSGATLGVPKILAIDCCANDGVLAFRDLSERVCIEFIYFFLMTTTVRLREEMQKGGQPNLNTDIVKSIDLPVPDYQEQLAIVSEIKLETTRIDALIAQTERSIELLKERRAALITAAVTGQIDLREAA